MQPACPHEQSMSGVFSIASHSVLQYLPDVVTHEQTGCAHFSAFAVAISFLLGWDQQRMIQDGILDTGKKRFRPKRNTFQFGSQSGNRRCEWQYRGFRDQSCRRISGAGATSEIIQPFLQLHGLVNRSAWKVDVGKRTPSKTGRQAAGGVTVREGFKKWPFEALSCA